MQGIWIHKGPTPEDRAEKDGEWTIVNGHDIAGEGDVHQIDNWKDGHTLDDLKKMVVQNNWSGFTLGKSGVIGIEGTVYFKNVNYPLVPSKTRVNSNVKAIYIAPIGSSW